MTKIMCQILFRYKVQHSLALRLFLMPCPQGSCRSKPRLRLRASLAPDVLPPMLKRLLSVNKARKIPLYSRSRAFSIPEGKKRKLRCYATSSSVASAIAFSSLVGMTNTAMLESSVEIRRGSGERFMFSSSL